MQDQEASTVLAALEKGWFHRHGYPISLLSDQGRNVDGRVIQDACESLGIQKLHSSPYHPQGDGEAKRCIQSFKQTMRCLLAQKRLDLAAWPQILREVSFTHNAQSNASTGFSPNQIMYGSRLRTRVDAAIPLKETNVYPDIDVYFEMTQRDNEELYEKVTSNTDIAQGRMKKYYDKGAKESEIGPGDWVLVKDECRPNTLSPLFKGPWLVVEKRDGNLHISDQGSTKTRVVHVNRCKKAEPKPREVTLRCEISETISNSDHDDPMSTPLSSDEIGMGAKSGDGVRRSKRQKRAPNW